IDINSWNRVNYEIQYQFKKGNQTAGFKYWVNGKGEFNANFQKLSPATNADELLETITKILAGKPQVIVNRNKAKSILAQIEFDIAIEEEKPFLKNLFVEINSRLNTGETINDVQHLHYRERYTIEGHGGTCVVDFEYNSAGFFGRVLPIEKQCNSPELLVKIKQIIDNLKSVDYVV